MDIVKYGEALVPESMRSDWDAIVKAHNSDLMSSKPKRPSMSKVLTEKEDLASAVIGLAGCIASIVAAGASYADSVDGITGFTSNEMILVASSVAAVTFISNLFSIHLTDESLFHRISRLCRKAFGLSGEFTASGRAYQRAIAEYGISEIKYAANLRKQSKKLKPILARLNSMDSRYSFDFGKSGLTVHENMEYAPLQEQLEHFIEKAKSQ